MLGRDKKEARSIEGRIRITRVLEIGVRRFRTNHVGEGLQANVSCAKEGREGY